MNIIDEINQFDNSLLACLSSTNLSPLRILFKNPTKGTITVLVHKPDSRDRYVIKWCKKNAPRETLQGFNKELSFYKKYNERSYAPNLICAQERLLILEYIPGCTLREWLIRYVDRMHADDVSQSFRRLVDILLDKLEDLYLENLNSVHPRIHEQPDKLISYLVSIYGKLYSSGPMGTSRGKLESKISKHLGRIARRRVSHFIQDLLRHGGTSTAQGLVHGDLHLNNMLITDDYDMKIIDFSNYSVNGFPLVDLLYFTAMVGAILRAHPKHKQYFKRQLSERLLLKLSGAAEYFERFLPIMELSVSINSRFLYGASNREIVQAQFTFLVRSFTLTQPISWAKRAICKGESTMKKIVRGIPSPIKAVWKTLFHHWLNLRTQRLTRDELHDYWSRPNDGVNIPENFMREDYQQRTQFLLRIVEEIAEPNAKILEIGCNVGRNLNGLFEVGFIALTGIEISEYAAKMLKEIYPKMASHATIFNQPVERIIRKLGDDIFDVVFTMAVLEHIPYDSEFIFKEIVRITSKYLITIEDEKCISKRHFPRNYTRVFEPLGMQEIQHINCKDVKGLGPNFEARIFVNPTHD